VCLVLCVTQRHQQISKASADCGSGSMEDSISLHSIESIRYCVSSMGCLGRGTITLVSVHDEFPVLRVTLNNATAVYEDLRQVRLLAFVHVCMLQSHCMPPSIVLVTPSWCTSVSSATAQHGSPVEYATAQLVLRMGNQMIQVQQPNIYCNFLGTLGTMVPRHYVSTQTVVVQVCWSKHASKMMLSMQPAATTLLLQLPLRCSAGAKGPAANPSHAQGCVSVALVNQCCQDTMVQLHRLP
jgi:hypothetical protein